MYLQPIQLHPLPSKNGGKLNFSCLKKMLISLEYLFQGFFWACFCDALPVNVCLAKEWFSGFSFLFLKTLKIPLHLQPSRPGYPSPRSSEGFYPSPQHMVQPNHYQVLHLTLCMYFFKCGVYNSVAASGIDSRHRVYLHSVLLNVFCFTTSEQTPN